MICEAYAKVNLTLEVFAVRGDGYHALRSVVVPISLSDTLEIAEGSSFSSDTGYVDDLCLKAARVLDPARGVSVRVKKRIPAGGGLGGGSADAAAVLRALNELRALGLSRGELAELGAQIGSDVPALAYGGPVLMEGRGEHVASIVAPRLELVLVNPGVPVSTRDVYAACSTRSPGGLSPTDRMVAALAVGDLQAVADALSNDLLTPALGLRPEVADALALLRTAGAMGVSMSGSGCCVFGLVRNADEATRISAEMNVRGYQAWAVHTMTGERS